MAVKFNIESGEKVNRSDIQHVNPFDIKAGVQSRIIAAADYQDQVRDRALSFAKVGQLQPAVGRKDKNGDLHLVLGNTRWDAAKLYRTGFNAVDPDDGQTRYFHDPAFQFQIIVEKLTDDEAFDRAVLENHSRNDTTDVQEALAQKHYREERGWTDTKIASFYGYTNSNRVLALKHLLDLQDDIVQRVHQRKLSVDAALTLGKAPAGDRVAILDAVTDPKTGKANPAALREKVREVLGEASDANDSLEVREQPVSTPVGTQGVTSGDTGSAPREKAAAQAGTQAPKDTIKRTVKDFKKLAAEVIADEEGNETVKNLFARLVDFLDGTKGQRSVQNAIDALKVK